MVKLNKHVFAFWEILEALYISVVADCVFFFGTYVHKTTNKFTVPTSVCMEKIVFQHIFTKSGRNCKCFRKLSEKPLRGAARLVYCSCVFHKRTSLKNMENSLGKFAG